MIDLTSENALPIIGHFRLTIVAISIEVSQKLIMGDSINTASTDTGIIKEPNADTHSRAS
jgi:hypothetical protein